MQRKIINCIILAMICLSFTSIIKAQLLSDHIVFEKSILQRGNFIVTDKLGNLYVIDNNQLLKYNSTLKPEKTYSNLTLGNISFIDVSNPLKIILYYRDFSQIEFLDNTLSPSGDPLVLTSIGMEFSTLICSSYDNGLWLYEPQNFQLTRLDNKLSISLKSGNLSMILGEEIHPDYMMESENYLYLNDPYKGIKVFDRFGTYFKTIPVISIHSFQIIGNILYYYTENTLFVYNLKTHEENKIALPVNNPLSVSIFRGLKQMKMYIQTKGEIISYLLE